MIVKCKRSGPIERGFWPSDVNLDQSTATVACFLVTESVVAGITYQVHYYVYENSLPLSIKVS